MPGDTVTGVVQPFRQLFSQGIEGYFAVMYARSAKDTPRIQKGYADLAEQATAVIAEGLFLEVGPGPAFVSIEIARRAPGAQIIGLDISGKMIDIAQRNVEQAGLSERISLRQGDAARLPFADAEFDFVVSSASLHHWKEPARILNEIYRVLKPGKPALIFDVRRDASTEKVDEFCRGISSRFMRWGVRHSIREGYTPESMQHLLSQTRFGAAERIQLTDIGMSVWLRRPPE